MNKGLNAKFLLANYLLNQAEWRERVAAEHPDDLRNGQAASSLHGLAVWVSALPEDDPRLIQIAALQEDYALDTLIVGPEAGRFASRYGFSRPENDPDGWLSAFVELLIGEELEGLDDFDEFGVLPDE